MITDEMLRIAAEMSSAEFVNRMEQDYNPGQQHRFSMEFEKKIKKVKRKADYPVLYRILQRVASITLAILIGGSAWLAVDIEVRAEFFGWIKEVCGTFFVYRYSGDMDTIVEQTKYRPKWVPEEYTECFADDAEDGGTVLYENEAGEYLKFVYVVDPSESSLYADNEEFIKHESKVNEFPADYLKSEKPEYSDALVWVNECNHLLYVAGFLSEEELIMVAESIYRMK